MRLDVQGHEHDEHLVYVVRVTRACSEDASSKLMLQMVMSPEGVVQEVVPSVTASLFGFKSEALLGKPLRSFVSVFRDFCDKHGQEASPRVMQAMIDK